MRKVLLTAVMVLAMVGVASAATMQVVSRTIDFAPDQEVLIVARGPEAVGGVNLYVQIGDGGDQNIPAGTDRAGVDVARLTGLNFRSNGAIWGADPALLEDPGLFSPELAFGTFVLSAGSKQLPNEATGGAVVGTLTLDATGLAGKTFMILLEAQGAPADLAGVPTETIGGQITVIPEPASLLMLLALAPMIRRRR